MGAVGVIALVVAIANSKPSLGSRSYPSLVALQEDLARITGLSGVSPESLKGWFATTENVHLSGRLEDGRRARVEFFQKSAGKSSVPYVRFQVDCDRSLKVSVYKESIFTPLGKWLGVTKDVDSGDASFDGAYVVSTEQDRKAELAYARGLKDAIRQAFEKHSAASFEFEDGLLTVTVHRSELEPGQYRSLFAALDRAAKAFDRVPLVVRALGNASRRAFRGPEGAPRCAYCHGDLTGEEEDLVACERCHTVLHGGCWDELGHCPLLGCTGHTPERTRARG
jgi:hypothetical protein